jgi:hypothetical protein
VIDGSAFQGFGLAIVSLPDSQASMVWGEVCDECEELWVVTPHSDASVVYVMRSRVGGCGDEQLSFDEQDVVGVGTPERIDFLFQGRTDVFVLFNMAPVSLTGESVKISREEPEGFFEHASERYRWAAEASETLGRLAELRAADGWAWRGTMGVMGPAPPASHDEGGANVEAMDESG